MEESVQVKRKIYGKNTFLNVIDTEFRQLIPLEPKTLSAPETTVESFFDYYDTLFYDIPVTGSINSHQQLVNKSLEYIGINIADLEEEIKILREENVFLKTQLFNLSNISI